MGIRTVPFGLYGRAARAFEVRLSAFAENEHVTRLRNDCAALVPFRRWQSFHSGIRLRSLDKGTKGRNAGSRMTYRCIAIGLNVVGATRRGTSSG